MSLLTRQQVYQYIDKLTVNQNQKFDQVRVKQLKEAVWTEINLTQEVAPFRTEKIGLCTMKYAFHRYLPAFIPEAHIPIE